MIRYHAGIRDNGTWYVRLNNERPAFPDDKRLVARCRDQHGNDVYLDVTDTRDWQKYNTAALGLLVVDAGEAEQHRQEVL